jgi:hypothetical protein
MERIFALIAEITKQFKRQEALSWIGQKPVGEDEIAEHRE